ncbi:EF-hand domain-containing family member B [Erinaceus europaeus]|uniref:EF-hand domain-containing family member B n=1 Tax=Erinaceus europaeus TaxID=9365 RepID=A0A1S3A693_ERIEU|nr:EF-hand domain-containing family member B [Erinaceus europaeus]
MCSFVRVRSPEGSGPPESLEASFESGRTFPLEKGALGGGGRSPMDMEVGLSHQRKDALEERQVFTGGNAPRELALGVGLGKENSSRRQDLLVGNPCEGMASPETKPRNKELELRLKRQNISGAFAERSHLAASTQETKPLGMLPRTGFDEECLLAQPPLSMGFACPQAPEGRGGAAAAAAPEGLGGSVGRKAAAGPQPRQQVAGEPTGALPGPSTERTPPAGVDTGLPQAEKADGTTDKEPHVALVLEPPEFQFAQKPEERAGAENTEPGIEPPDRIRPIYSGKFFDRMPCWPTAGKVIPVGYRVANCLTEKLPRLTTPPEVKKFYNFRHPPVGAKRVFYGRANDPQIAPYLTHGIGSTHSILADALINPQPITSFQQKVKEKKESIYFTNQRAPLGRSYDQTPGLPKGLDVLNTTFGTASIREMSAREVVNPPKSFKEVFKEGKEGHDLYIVSHNDHYPGEAKNRKYNSPNFHRFKLYGVPTPHFNDGRNMAKTLYWLHELQMSKGAKIVSKRADDFNEKFHHKLGRVWDPIAETMTVPPDYTYGACLYPDACGAGDLIHNRLPGEYLRGTERQRAQIAAVRHHFKKVNYQHFDTLLAAFRHYDKKGDGMIDKEELREACEQNNLHLDDTLLGQLFDYCDVDKDGMISYLEFANFLSWKDKMPLKEFEKKVIVKGRKSHCANLTEANVEGSEPTLLIKPEDIVLKEPGRSEETLRTLQRPSDRVSHGYKTTSSEIGAAAPSVCEPVCGVPTIRSDIPAPRIRRISDRTNYGEDGNAYSLLHPTIFSQKGVSETDFFKTRSKKEIAEILCNIGVKLSEEEFETVWDLASKRHRRGEVCVENIRDVLDELSHADRIKRETTA